MILEIGTLKGQPKPKFCFKRRQIKSFELLKEFQVSIKTF